MHEREQIDLARQGDGRAWEGLLQTHQAAAFRLAYLLLGNADDAQDVTQEAFVRAFRSLGRFDRERPFRPWLLRIVTNLAHNQRRSAGRATAALERLFRGEPEPRGLTAGPDPARRERAETLWRAVRRLGRNDREILYLRFFLDLPVEETATVLGIAAGTVKSRTHRALDRLRSTVERDFPVLTEGYEA